MSKIAHPIPKMAYKKYTACVKETARILSLDEKKVVEVLETFHAVAAEKPKHRTLFLTAIVDEKNRFGTFDEKMPVWNDEIETLEEILERTTCTKEELYFEGHVAALNKIANKKRKKNPIWAFWYCDEDVGEFSISDLKITISPPGPEYNYWDELVDVVANISIDKHEHQY